MPTQLMFIDFVNQNIWWFAGWAIVFNLLLFSFMQNSVAGTNQVSALEMPQLQRKGKSIIIDVNPADTFASQHIPQSVNFQIDELNAENKTLSKHKNSTVILVDQTGARSAKAAKLLVALDFKNVNILRGGLVGWTKENLPVTSA